MVCLLAQVCGGNSVCVCVCLLRCVVVTVCVCAGVGPDVRMVSCGADKSIYFRTAEKVGL